MKGCLDAAPFGRVVQNWIQDDEEFSVVRLANLMKMDVSYLRKILNGTKPVIGFDIADKIVSVCTDGLGWINDPELEEIYQSYDFGWLDRAKPCAPAHATTASGPCVEVA